MLEGAGLLAGITPYPVAAVAGAPGSRAAAGLKPSVVRLDVTRAAALLSTRLRGAREFTAACPA